MADEQNRSDARPDAPPPAEPAPGKGQQPKPGSPPSGKGQDDPSLAPESGDKKATG